MGQVQSIIAAGIVIGGGVISVAAVIINKLKKRPPMRPAPMSRTIIESHLGEEDDGSENHQLIIRLKETEDELARKSLAMESMRQKTQEERQFVEEIQENLDREWQNLKEAREKLEKEKNELEQRKKLAVLRSYQSIAAKIQTKAALILDLDCVTSYNVAITGQAGSGKSTLINSLCGYDHDDQMAAPVDVTECTQVMKKYINPQIDHLVLWDCPGAGTLAHPIETYFEDKMLYAFDFLIILFTERNMQQYDKVFIHGITPRTYHSRRFKEIDAALIKNAIEHEIPIAVVRNKANNDLTAMKKKAEYKNLPNDQAIKKLIEKLRQDTTTSLIQLGDFTIPDIFIINVWAFGDENEPQFEEAQLLTHVATVIEERRKK